MGIAPEPSNLVAPDAVGRRALIVTARAAHDVPSCSSSVQALRGLVRADPARRMGIGGANAVTTDASGNMTAIAILDSVAANAARRLRLRLHRVPRHEVAAVYELPHHTLWLAALNANPHARVMAAVAARFGVARSAKFLVRLRVGAVPPHKPFIVEQKGSRERSFQVGAIMTRRALPAFPLLLMFVTVQALLHGWHGGGGAADNARVTCDALTRNFLQPQVPVMIKMDRSRTLSAILGRRWPAFVSVITMASRALARIPNHMSAVTLPNDMTAVAAETLGLARPATSKLGKVSLVRKAWGSSIGAGGKSGSNQQDGRKGSVQ